jgi:RNA polymerase sigma-70 factor, ECF subfamily
MSDASVIVLHGSASPAPLVERDDEALMALAAAEYRPAFEVLVHRYLPRLTSFCSKFVGSPRTGEELAQETLIETWARRHRYASSGKFKTFLFTLARNRCLNHVRDEGRHRRWNAGAGLKGRDAEPAEPDQLDALLDQERRRRVREALLALPAKLREAVLLRFDQGLDYAEVARVVGRPQATVRSRVFLALKRLRAEFAGGDL